MTWNTNSYTGVAGTDGKRILIPDDTRTIYPYCVDEASFVHSVDYVAGLTAAASGS